MKGITKMEEIIFFCKVLIFFKFIISNPSVMLEQWNQQKRLTLATTKDTTLSL